MRPLVMSLKTAPNETAEAYLSHKRFEPDGQLSTIDKPPRAILDLKSEASRDSKLAMWRQAQSLKIEQSIMQKRQAAFNKAGVYWWTGRVIAIAIMDPLTKESEPIVIANEDEKALIKEFFALLSTPEYSSSYLTGRATKDFDIPFLTGRAMAHNIGLPPQVFSKYQITDIHEMFGRHTGATQRGKLGDYAFGLGIKMDEEIESTTFLFDQTKLGNASAWNELKHRALKEVRILSDIMLRYHKPFLKPKPVPTNIPF